MSSDRFATYTVISYYPEENQLCCDFIVTTSAETALTVAARNRPTCELVCAIPGRQKNIEWAGFGLVGSEQWQENLNEPV